MQLAAEDARQARQTAAKQERSSEFPLSVSIIEILRLRDARTNVCTKAANIYYSGFPLCLAPSQIKELVQLHDLAIGLLPFS